MEIVLGNLVSIIMPAFNSAQFIRAAIESVLSQTYQDWELIICDDRSTDDTLKIAQEYSHRDCRISVIKNMHNKGAPGARNSCLDVAKGRYIAFLDADDLWLPSKLTLQISFMSDHGYSFVYSYYDVMDESGKIRSQCKAPGSVNAKFMKLSNFIPCLTAVYDRNVVGNIYQPDLKKRNDYALWLKILNSGKVTRAHCFPKSTAQYRSNSYGLSSDKRDALKYFHRCLIEYGNCTLGVSYIYCALYLATMLIKKKCNFIYNFIIVRFR